jgi:hypothetical protein
MWANSDSVRHADEQSATLPRPSGPTVDKLVNGLPAPEIEVAGTKIGTVRDFQSLPQCWEKILFNVVEDAGHGARNSALQGSSFSGGERR